MRELAAVPRPGEVFVDGCVPKYHVGSMNRQAVGGSVGGDLGGTTLAVRNGEGRSSVAQRDQSPARSKGGYGGKVRGTI